MLKHGRAVTGTGIFPPQSLSPTVVKKLVPEHPKKEATFTRHNEIKFINNLGKGAYGTVDLYENQSSPGSFFAIKTATCDKERLALENEASILCELNANEDPCVVKCHGYFEMDFAYGGTMWLPRRLALEYAPEGDLNKLLEKEGHFNEAKAAKVFSLCLFSAYLLRL